MDNLPHLALPLSVTSSTYHTLEQDTLAEVATCVTAILRFERGSRPEQLEFGITDPTFQQMPVDTNEIEAQAAIYEPRAELAVTTTSAPTGESTVRVEVAMTEGA